VIAAGHLSFVNTLVIHSDSNIFKNLKVRHIAILGNSNYFDNCIYESLNDYGQGNEFQ
jgi:hypothetical protein